MNAIKLWSSFVSARSPQDQVYSPSEECVGDFDVVGDPPFDYDEHFKNSLDAQLAIQDLTVNDLVVWNEGKPIDINVRVITSRLPEEVWTEASKVAQAPRAVARSAPAARGCSAPGVAVVPAGDAKVSFPACELAMTLLVPVFSGGVGFAVGFGAHFQPALAALIGVGGIVVGSVTYASVKMWCAKDTT